MRVIQGAVTGVDLDGHIVQTDFGEVQFDFLLLACGAGHRYFGHSEWEEHAPGLKTIEQAERSSSPAEQKHLLTYVVIGGGPTGVELTGAIGETSRYTLSRDFRSVDATLARVLFIEAEPRILPMFSNKLARLVARPYVLPHRISQPLFCRDQLGVVVSVVPERREADR